MKSIFKAFAFCILLFQGAIAVSFDLKLESDQLRSELTDRVFAMKEGILRNLDSNDRQEASKINIVVNSSNDPGMAFALTEHGVPRIEIGVGFAQMLSYLVDAGTMLAPSETIDYVNFIVKSQRENLKRTQKGEAQKRIPYFFEWADWSKSRIDQFKTDKQGNETREKIFIGALMFVLAHEYAHHILGHTNLEAPSLDVRRRNEEKADLFAAKLLIKMDFGPIVGWYAFVYFSALDCDAMLHEDERTHPADIRRLEMIIEMTENNIDKLTVANGYSKQQIKEELKNVLLATRTAISKSISCLESGKKGEKNSPYMDEFSKGIKVLLQASSLKFDSVRGNHIDFFDAEDDEPAFDTYQCSIMLPGSNIGEIWLPKDSSGAYTSFRYYTGTSHGQALSVYKELISNLDKCVPADWKRTEKITSGQKSARTRYDFSNSRDERSISLHLSSYSSGRNTVTLMINEKND